MVVSGMNENLFEMKQIVPLVNKLMPQTSYINCLSLFDDPKIKKAGVICKRESLVVDGEVWWRMEGCGLGWRGVVVDGGVWCWMEECGGG